MTIDREALRMEVGNAIVDAELTSLRTGLKGSLRQLLDELGRIVGLPDDPEGERHQIRQLGDAAIDVIVKRMAEVADRAGPDCVGPISAYDAGRISGVCAARDAILAFSSEQREG